MLFGYFHLQGRWILWFRKLILLTVCSFQGSRRRLKILQRCGKFDWQKDGILVLWPGILFGTWTIQLQVYVVDEVQTTLIRV